MITIPPDTPVTIPLVESTTATILLLLLQLPPEVVLLKVIDEVSHTVSGPDIPARDKDTTWMIFVTVVVPQLLVTEYFIVSTPAAIPATTPLVFTTAILVLLLDQMPPEVLSDNVIEYPMHKLSVPLMAATEGGPEQERIAAFTLSQQPSRNKAHKIILQDRFMKPAI